jgi:hypothetical protein
MQDLFFSPDLPMLLSGVSVHGTGFDREVLPLSLAVILFAGWMMKGAPVNDQTRKGTDLLWILIGAFVLWGLFGCAPANAAPDPAPVAAVAESAPALPVWNNLDVTPLAVLVFLIFAIPGGNGKKALAALAVIPAGMAHAGGAGADLAPAASWWTFPLSLTVSMLSLIFAKWTAGRQDKARALAFVLLALWSGFIAIRTAPDAHAGVIGNLFESDAERMAAEAKRARALAELERQRTDSAIRHQAAALDAERQRALLRAAGYGDQKGRVETWTWILFVAAGGSVAMAAYWLRRSEAAEAEIRRLSARLEVAERRADLSLLALPDWSRRGIR